MRRHLRPAHLLVLLALLLLACGPKPQTGDPATGSEAVVDSRESVDAALTAGLDPGAAGRTPAWLNSWAPDSTGVTDASVEELLTAAEAALNRAAGYVNLQAGDAAASSQLEDRGDLRAELDLAGYHESMAEVLFYLHEAEARLSADPEMYPLMRSAYEKLLPLLRGGLEAPGATEDVLEASEAELAEARAASYANGVSYELPVDPDNALVQKYLALYQQGRRRAYIQDSFNRAGRYRDFIIAEIRARGLPEELWVVPIIESGYKASAYSRTRAVGIWQFMAATARKYGLKVNQWLDERRDPVKSTRAALDYLTDLYEWFNDWDLALAAYNRGEYGLARDIRNSGIVDFMEMAELGVTHRETRNHVPQIHAAAIIAKNPERYGFTFEFEEPVEADTLYLDYVVDLEVAAECAGISETALRELNPELRTWVTPVLSRDYPVYPLKLPKGSMERFNQQIAKVDDLTPKRQVSYVVRRGDTLGAIGRRFGVSWRSIQRWNNLRSSRIYPGQRLVIFPGDHAKAYAAATPTSSRGSRAPASRNRVTRATAVTQGGESYYVYRVRRGDTLYDIARDFGVTVNDLQRWNGVGTRIVAGQELKIKRAGDLAAASSPAGEPAIHVVRKGDTLSGIAKRYGTTVASLRRWNTLGRYLHPGQEIKIYKD